MKNMKERKISRSRAHTHIHTHIHNVKGKCWTKKNDGRD